MRKIPFYDPGAGGGGAPGENGASGADGGQVAADKPDPQAVLLASLAGKVKALEEEKAARIAADQEAAAKIAADKAAAERAEALKRGEHERIIAEKEAALKATTERLTAAEQREQARIARFEAAAKEAAEKLAPEMKAVVDSIPDPEARLAAIRTLSAEKVSTGPGPRQTAPKPVVIPQSVIDRANDLGYKPESLYAILVARGEIKPAQTGTES